LHNYASLHVQNHQVAVKKTIGPNVPGTANNAPHPNTGCCHLANYMTVSYFWA